MRCLAVLLCVAATSLAAQEPEPPPDSARAAPESVPAPPPPETLEQKRFLAGLCGSSRGFLRRGRPQMSPTVYEDSVQLKARRLVSQVDSLIKYTTTCEGSAAATPNATVVGLGKRMKSYDAALRDFRVAIGLPVKEDTSKATKRP